MSYAAMAAIRGSGLEDATLVDVLEALAFFMNDRTGECFPSVPMICKVARKSDKSTRKAIKDLEQMGLITTKQRPGSKRFFQIHFDKLPPMQVPEEGDEPVEEVQVVEDFQGVEKVQPLEKVPPTPGSFSADPWNFFRQPLKKLPDEQGKNKEITRKEQEIFVANAPKSAARAADPQDQPELFQNLEGQSVPVKRSRSAFPPCPYARIVELYHEKLPSLPQVVKITPSRRSAIGARWRDICEDIRSDGDEVTEAKALENFGMFFDRVAHSDYLMGRTPRSSGHQNWRCNLDFLMRQQPFFRVIEGGY